MEHSTALEILHVHRPISRITPAMPFDRAVFDNLAANLRFVITHMICRAGSGHIGGALSLVEILLTLYCRVLRLDPRQPDWAGRDRVILSKGHAGPALYATLAALGYFPWEELLSLNANGTRLPSHCDMLRTPGVDMTAGSLGQGLSAAAGMALGGRMSGQQFRVFCIVGDGESDEGQIWEAALFAGHQRLGNLIAITDYNKLQIDGPTRDVLDLEPLADKWRACNWRVLEVDGHDWDALHQACTTTEQTGRPTMIIAHTVKARGHRTLAGTPESHNVKVPDAEAWQRMLAAVTDSSSCVPSA